MQLYALRPGQGIKVKYATENGTLKAVRVGR
jgi:hypothetical protein